MVINFIFWRICQSNILAGYLASGEVRSVAKRSIAIRGSSWLPPVLPRERFVLRNLLFLLFSFYPTAGVAWKASANVPPMTIKICRQHI